MVASGSPRSRLAAPRHTISRAASSSLAMSASLNWSPWKSANGRPNWWRASRGALAPPKKGAPPASQTGRYVETAAVEPLHGDFEAVAFLAETIGDRDSAILE